MSWSLRVSNGDLVLGGASLATVTDENKLVQDFRHYLLTRLGSDPMHRNYGSVLDGGTDINGNEIPSMVGNVDWDRISLQVESEIRRCAIEYQNQQIQRAKQDSLRYNKSTQTAGEILASISDVELIPQEDTLHVIVHIVSGRNNALSLTVPLS